MQHSRITDHLRPTRPFQDTARHASTPAATKKRPAVEAMPLPAKKMSKAIPRPATPPTASAILGSFFRSQDRPFNTQDTIDLTFDSDDEEEESWHMASESSPEDTPESSRGTDRSSQTSASSASPSPIPASKPAQSVKQAPAWALFRQEPDIEEEDAEDDAGCDQIFLPIPVSGRAQPPLIKQEQQDIDEEETIPAQVIPDHDVIELHEVDEAPTPIVEEQPMMGKKLPAVIGELPNIPEKLPDDSISSSSITAGTSASISIGTSTIASANASSSISATTTATEANTQPPRPRGPRAAPFQVVESHMRIKIMQAQKDGRLAVPWGVQYYIASLASLDYVSLDELNPAKGTDLLRSSSNATSMGALFDPANQHLLWESRIDTPIIARPATDRERQVYQELDRENEIRAESKLNGVIGPPGEEMRSFGGRVLFEGRLVCSKVEENTRGGKNSKHRRISIQLFPPKLGGSCRFSRRFGSESILRLKMDPAMVKDARRFPDKGKYQEIQQEILQLFQRPIQIMGRYYRPFFCKDETVFYLWVDSVNVCPDRPEAGCIWDLIDHHAPFAQNGRSQLGKFIQRVQLGLSTSVPASVVDTITHVRDIFGDPDSETGKPQEMTDGASCASLAVFKDIAQHLGYDTIPSAFQGRVAGAKGVWYIEPTATHALPNERPTRWIEVRDSQKKIHYLDDKPRDLSQTVIDLLGPSRTFAPSTLSRQIILVMQSNGVPTDTFADMQRIQLQAIADEISNWDGPSDLVRMRLATTVERLCKVESVKAKRSTESAEHRAQGMESQISSSSNSNTRDPTLGDDDREIFFGQNGRHLWNDMPVSKHERAYEMLLTGFHPERCAYLAELLVDIADLAMRKLIKKFAIPIARSAEAMVIPDPTGTLEEGEIQFRFSADNVLDPDTRLRYTHVPEGDVLVTRHPCLLPTDVRKVKAVVRPELSLYKDVVVFSTKGQRPLASLLSGGDYDGDLIRVFWEPKLVEPFENADAHFADCPFPIEEVFDRSEKTVAEFVAEHGDKHTDERDRALIKQLVAAAFEPATRGLYGAMHLYAAWQFGTSSPEAVVLAHKFCQCMDSSKTGLSIKPRVRIQDSKQFAGDLPAWGYDAVDESDPKDWFAMDDFGRTSTAIKNQALSKSVLCELWEQGKEEVSLLKARLHKQADKLRSLEDTDISGAWTQAQSLGRIDPEWTNVILTHVKVVEESYARTNARTRREIENRTRDMRNGTATAKNKEEARKSHSVPLRRVRSEAPRSAGPHGRGPTDGIVDDLNSGDMLSRLDGTIEVPVTLTSASEVAARYCQWPKAFAKDHIDKMDKLEIERLAKLRASYTYSISYKHKPKFAFEMAWRWIMDLKAQASGSMQLPTTTVDLLSLRTKIIRRNFEMSQGRGVEV